MKNWRDAVVRPNSSIRDTLRAIDKGAQNIALVCDELDKLIAVVSDGDIRRGLLSELHMDDPVSAVANTKPRVAQQGVTRDKLKQILTQEAVSVLPVLDQENRVVELHTLFSLEERPALENPVFIMAGGFGTRLKPLTDNCPKPMLPIGDKPILQHTIERMRKQGFRHFFISTHYLPEQIKDHFGDGSELDVNISYVHEEQPLGTGGALGLLPPDIAEKPLILLNGDILTDLDFGHILESHEDKGADATMCLRELETSLAYGVVEVVEGNVTGMMEKPTYRHLINTGMYVLSDACVKSVERGMRIDLPSLLEQRIQAGCTVNAYTFYGKWIDIGQMTDYVRAQSTFQTLGY